MSCVATSPGKSTRSRFGTFDHPQPGEPTRLSGSTIGYSGIITYRRGIDMDHQHTLSAHSRQLATVLSTNFPLHPLLNVLRCCVNCYLVPSNHLVRGHLTQLQQGTRRVR